MEVIRGNPLPVDTDTAMRLCRQEVIDAVLIFYLLDFSIAYRLATIRRKERPVCREGLYYV